MAQNKTLDIRLLGGLSLVLDGEVLTGFKSRKAEALFVYLVLVKRPLTRNELAYIFWEDSEEEQARCNLRRTLSDLRKRLDPWLTVTRHTICFNQNATFWLDVDVVQSEMAQLETIDKDEMLTVTQTAVLQESLSHYHGELLAGVYLTGAQPFEEWVALERERLRLQVHNALYRLSEHCLYYGRYQDGILQAQRLTQFDSLYEDGHLLLLRLYVRHGQRNAALKHYQTYQILLDEELGVEPEPEMKNLVKRIRQLPPQTTSSLPAYPNSFVGRHTEQAQLDKLLDKVEQPPANRLMTLLGSGGVGKTRLAIETARQRQAEYKDGVFFVSLAAVTTAVQLPSTLILALHLSPSNSKTPQQQLLDGLRQRHMLLILDNMEHLLPDAVNLLQDILTTAPRITLLVTSRSRLYLQTEAILPLHGLPFPETDTAVSTNFASIQLLQQRAAHYLHIEDEQLQMASQICRLVAGSPLALELAAATLDDHSLAEVATAIQQNLDFLTSKFHDVPQRQRSLRAIFHYSWMLLPTTQQTIFAQLSLFAGGFTAETAQQVCKTAKSVLQKLIDKSLIVYTETDGRYHIHPLLRQFANEQLIDEEQTKAKERIVTYFTNWLANHESTLYGRNPQTILTQIDSEIDNIRQAWSWAVACGAETAVDRSLESLYRYFDIRSWYEEGVEQFSLAAAACTSVAIQMRLHNRQAKFCQRLGNIEEALVLFTQTQSFFAQSKNAIEEAIACFGLSRCYSDRTEYDLAFNWAEKSLHLSEQEGHLSGQASALGQLGVIQKNRGQFEEAQQYYQAALNLYEQSQDDWQLIAALNNVGMIAGILGQYDQAKAHFEHTLTLCQQMNDRYGQARALQNLSIVAFIGKDFVSAKEMRLEVLAICQEIGAQWGIASSLHHLGDVYRRLGAIEIAYDYYQQSLPLWQEIGNERSELLTHNSIGNMYLELEEFDKADTHFQQVIERAMAAQLLPIVLAALCSRARIVAAHDDIAQAVKLISFALHHPACEGQTKDGNASFMAELLEKLPSETAVAAQAEGQKLATQENGLVQLGVNTYASK